MENAMWSTELEIHPEQSPAVVSVPDAVTEGDEIEGNQQVVPAVPDASTDFQQTSVVLTTSTVSTSEVNPSAATHAAKAPSGKHDASGKPHTVVAEVRPAPAAAEHAKKSASKAAKPVAPAAAPVEKKKTAIAATTGKAELKAAADPSRAPPAHKATKEVSPATNKAGSLKPAGISTKRADKAAAVSAKSPVAPSPIVATTRSPTKTAAAPKTITKPVAKPAGKTGAAKPTPRVAAPIGARPQGASHPPQMENLMWDTALEVHPQPVALAQQPAVLEEDESGSTSRGMAIPIDTSTTLPIAAPDAGTGFTGPVGAESEATSNAVVNATGEGAISNIVQIPADETPTSGGLPVQTEGQKSNENKNGPAAEQHGKARRVIDKMVAAVVPRKAKKTHTAAPTAAAAEEPAGPLAPVTHATKSQHPHPAARKHQAVDKAYKAPMPSRTHGDQSSAQSDSPETYAHRHFHNLHPTANKLVAARWDAEDRRIHARKLATVKSSIDTTAPPTYSHLENKKKTVQLALERQQQITRDNDILLEKMAAIMKLEAKAFDQCPSPLQFAHSLHADKRIRDATQIDKDNLAILHRLEARGSFYPHGEALTNRVQNLHYLRNRAAYPARFIAEEKQYEHLCSTHTSTHNPAMGQARRQEIVRDWTSGAVRPAMPDPHQQHHGHHSRQHQNIRQQKLEDEFRSRSSPPRSAGRRASSPKLAVAESDQAFVKGEGQVPLPTLPSIQRSTHELAREESPLMVAV
ncbi:Ubiquitin-protein ligase [Thoreauomyces humboldtii]|nr:Ubiquitin-protein ligase [Thoreauomyces humboldtii]